MKKIAISMIVAIAALCLVLSPVNAVKPSGPGAQTYTWSLSGAVMPVPPYGLSDILGSDVASKLIVNLPNGAVGAVITGVMNGLHPDTTYTVYLSNPYTPYKATGWDLTADYQVMYAVDGGGPNPALYDMSLSLDAGHGGYPSPGPYAYTWDVSDIVWTSGTDFHFTCTYTSGAVGTIMYMSGTIAADGSLSGTWNDNYGGGRTGTWYTTSGHATFNYSGDTGWQGLYTSTVQPFTFTTDGSGSGSWHINLPTTSITGTSASVWINDGPAPYTGSTVLISKNFVV
jgi:hypothetical protein